MTADQFHDKLKKEIQVKESVTMTNGDGTEVDHKQDIDDPNKETKALLAIGGSEDGGRERG